MAGRPSGLPRRADRALRQGLRAACSGAPRAEDAIVPGFSGFPRFPGLSGSVGVSGFSGFLAGRQSHPAHFTPQGIGHPQFEPLKKSSGGALMRTTGENTRFLAIHPKVPPTLPPSCRPSRRPARPARKLLKGLPSLPSEPILRGRK